MIKGMWRPVHVNYGAMIGYYLGAIRIGTVSINPHSIKGDTERLFVGNIQLPGVVTPRIYAPTQDEVQHEVELRTNEWLAKAGLEVRLAH